MLPGSSRSHKSPDWVRQGFCMSERHPMWGVVFGQNHSTFWLMAVSLTLLAGGTTINMMM